MLVITVLVDYVPGFQTELVIVHGLLTNRRMYRTTFGSLPLPPNHFCSVLTSVSVYVMYVYQYMLILYDS